MSSSLKLLSFAKINWILQVLGKRPDGYHQLQTVFQTIDLKDEISFQLMVRRSVELEVRGRCAPAGAENLLYRAAELMAGTLKARSGVRMVLEKRIPLGAGLGGGSSNAAVALLALNHLWKGGLTLQEMARLGAGLGSDVPFFLCGGMALGRGRGEAIEPWPDAGPRQSLLLLYPKLEIKAREAYALGNWGNLRHSGTLTREGPDTRIERFRQVVAQPEKAWVCLENDLEMPLFARYPVLEHLSRVLLEAGCKRAMLCGSGSTLMAAAEASRLERAAETIAQRKLGEVFLCHTLSREEYRKSLSRGGLELPEIVENV